MSKHENTALPPRPPDSAESPGATTKNCFSGIDFLVVGVGASAGEVLEAIRRFLSGMPSDPGMAFVVVQHLDPTHESMMVRSAVARHAIARDAGRRPHASGAEHGFT